MKRAFGASAVGHGLVALCLMVGFDSEPPVFDDSLVVELVSLAPPEAEPPPPQPPAVPVQRTQTQPNIVPKASARPVAPSPMATEEAPAAIAADPAQFASLARVTDAGPAPPADQTYVPPLSHADYLANPPPRYPPVATRRGWQGVVVLAVEVDEEGRPISVRVDSSSGYTVLDEAARATVAIWRFVPARRGQRPVAADVKVPIRFNLAQG